MIKLKKANKIVRVTENELEKYLTKGYVKIEDKVNEVQKIVSHEPIKKTAPVKKDYEQVKPKTRSRRKSND